ncbi:MAG: serine hydrolase [Lutibacter sp.]|uniref:serine hydrolase n=1 Tax=Lutibacter sp. TaxID=1925666 RepID=UPI003859B4FB
MKQYSQRSLRRKILLIIFIQVTTLSIVFGQSKAEKIDELMNLHNEYAQFNGSVLVVENGEVIYKKGLGLANMEWNIPNQPNTKHRLGSITKQFTSMLILQLVEQGKLSLNGKVSDYLPEYPKKSGNKITIHHLLTHSSGIPEYLMIPNFIKEKSRDQYTPTEFMSFFKNSPLLFTPGKEFSYSNSGYFLLGIIIEKVTGKSYEQVLQENIFTPLKMNNTGYDHHSSVLKNRASGYTKNGNEYRNATFIDMSIPYAAGSIFSTTEDLYLWDQALYTNQLLSKKTKALLFTPYMPAWDGGYGYGWHISKKSIGEKTDIKVISHTGGINGFSTLISRMPDQKNLIVLLNNVGGTDLTNIGISLINILYNAPYQMPKKSLAELLMETAMVSGFESAFNQFRELKNSNDYAVKENEINNLGYQVLGMGKAKEAIEIFMLNVETFPKSWNTYDSLGEAYLIDGNKDLAIKYYKKSIEINPDNTGGISALSKLQSE